MSSLEGVSQRLLRLAAASALQEAGLQIAPMPVLLDDGFAQPVVVQTWVEGEPIKHPLLTDEQWHELLRYYETVHAVTPDTSSFTLSGAISASSVAEARFLVAEQVSRIPDKAQPGALMDLVRRFEQAQLGEWESPTITLCRIDPNVSNFIRQPSGLTSVDWEYSGWGDPAFDIADLMAHPTNIDVDPCRWEGVVQAYGDIAGDPNVAKRIATYYTTLLVWWSVRSARFLYDVPRGLDSRLAPRPDNWETNARLQYQHYLELALLNLNTGCGYGGYEVRQSRAGDWSTCAQGEVS